MECRRALRGVQNAQPPAGPGSGVDQIPAALQSPHDRRHGLLDARELPCDGGGNLSVSLIHGGQNRAEGAVFDGAPYRMRLFRQQAIQHDFNLSLYKVQVLRTRGGT